MLCQTSSDCDALVPGSTCTETSPDSVVFERVLSPGSVVEGNPQRWKYANTAAKTAGGIYGMKITGKPRRNCASGPNDGAVCSATSECPNGACVWYYTLKLKAYGNMDNAVADMQTQIFSGAERWAVRGLWLQLTRGWKLDKNSDFLNPYP